MEQSTDLRVLLGPPLSDPRLQGRPEFRIGAVVSRPKLGGNSELPDPDDHPLNVSREQIQKSGSTVRIDDGDIQQGMDAVGEGFQHGSQPPHPGAQQVTIGRLLTKMFGRLEAGALGS